MQDKVWVRFELTYRKKKGETYYLFTMMSLSLNVLTTILCCWRLNSHIKNHHHRYL